MNYRKLALGAAIIAVLSSGSMAAPASPNPEEKGKVCRTEQQCHWENFKKVCVYVKVCR